MNNFISHVTMV